MINNNKLRYEITLHIHLIQYFKKVKLLWTILTAILEPTYSMLPPLKYYFYFKILFKKKTKTFELHNQLKLRFSLNIKIKWCSLKGHLKTKICIYKNKRITLLTWKKISVYIIFFCRSKIILERNKINNKQKKTCLPSKTT